MKIETLRFGKIKIDVQNIITIPEGLIGFPDLKHFVLLSDDSEAKLKWLQSVDDGVMSFVLTDPLVFKPDYNVDFSTADIVDLQLENPDDAVVTVVITIPEDPCKITANLKAPIVFNKSIMIGKQIVLKNPLYTTRYLVQQEKEI